MANFQEYLAKMRSGEINTTSKLGLRNENKQVKGGNSNLSWVKKEKDKTAKLLILKDLALPFDPFVGEATAEINSDNKFRTELSVSTNIKTLKAFYESEEGREVKQKVLNLLGESNWDTSQPEVITEKDKEIFKRFIVPRIYTHDMINIVSKTMHPKAFGNTRAYRANFQRDELGDVILESCGGEYPEILKLQGFFRQVALEKFNEFKEKNPDLTEQKLKDYRRDFLSEAPVSSDFKQNTAYVVELALENWKVKDLSKLKPEDLRKELKVIKITNSIKTTIKNLMEKYSETRDVYLDFLEIDLTVGDEEDAKLRGMNAKFGTAEVMINSYEGHENFLNAFSEMVDKLEKQE